MQAIGFYLLLPFIYLIAILPYWLIYRISDFIYFLLFRVIKYRRKVILENLTKAFPEKTPSEVKLILSDCYQNIADILVEEFKMIFLTERNFKKRFKVDNPELIERYHSLNRGVIVITGHYCHYEWAASAIAGCSKADTIAIYRPLKNPYFDRFIFKIRLIIPYKLTPDYNTFKVLKKYQNEAFTLNLIADQSPPKDGKGAVWVTFFGRKTLTYQGAEMIAKKWNAVVVFAHVRREKRGYYTMTFDLVCDEPESTLDGDITQMHSSKLETLIREKPGNWLWSHKRWKKSPIN